MRQLARPWVRQLLLWTLGGFVVGWLVSLLWWSMLVPNTPDPVEEITIPPGAADLVARGFRVPGVPSVIRAGESGTVRIINNDTAEHFLAGNLIRPGTIADIRPGPAEGQIACSFHPGGVIGYQLDARPPITVTFIPAAILGVPFGIAFGVAAIVARRLGDEPAEPSPA
ncbi:MAG: hypothetical protein WHT63_09755 [Tepidiforma sp.]|jgi:hypothetical protein|uniref:hypothetical protein n=1 Tax=Tepidiforma sp. TaxID=2682230 RepID=UPI0021DE7E20|nr:hypothetical protein [Tepidiforma sp.]MCX7618776.1 hypothetical protein [Tepidiforma sp.]GIW18041.1 MAG: hypothetical protein KatS3mg064_1198 [Tepidiforma sp.]